MSMICAWCGTALNQTVDSALVSHGICKTCAFHVSAQMGMPAKQYLEELPIPVVIIAPPEGFVIGANAAGRKMLGKPADQIVGFLGGEVFECEHSYLPAGCGETVHCGGCTIRRAVTATYDTGEYVVGQSVVLHQRTPEGTHDLQLHVSTQKVGNVVFLRIDK